MTSQCRALPLDMIPYNINLLSTELMTKTWSWYQLSITARYILTIYNVKLNMLNWLPLKHYNAVIVSVMSSQITSLTIVYSTVYPDADQRNNQSFVSLAFVRGIHWWSVSFPHQVTWKMVPFDGIMVLKVNRCAIINHITSCCLNERQVGQVWPCFL